MANWTVNEKSEGELKFTIEGDEWKKACKKAYNKLAPKVQVQGFRPGKAPKAMIDKLLPATAIYSEAMYDNILPALYSISAGTLMPHRFNKYTDDTTISVIRR